MTNHIEPHHNNISRASPNILAITKTSERAPNISAQRIAIENYLSSLPPDVTVSTKEVAQACECSMRKASNTLHSMAGDGFAVNTSTNKNHSAWRKKSNTIKKPSSTAEARTRICNGNQPNGNRAYWQAFERQRMTPARLELLTSQEMAWPFPKDGAP